MLSAGFSMVLGGLFRVATPSDKHIRLKHGMIIATLAWAWAAFAGALAMINVPHLTFIQALFENMSAWTGSGMTVFSNVEILPHSILFLRSLEQWFGGIGIVILVVVVLLRPGTAASKLYKSEARDERIKPSISNTIKTILWIYILYTLLGIVLYGIAGLGAFESINTCMTTISTGGMSIKNDNIGGFHSTAVTLVTIFIMILGANSFLVHYNLLKGKAKLALKDLQVQGMFSIIIFATILGVLTTKMLPLEVIFNVVTSISTTGASIQSTSEMIAWPGHFKILMLMCMIIGGAAGSTSGAVKISRVVTFLKGVYWEVMKNLSPEGSVIPRRLSGKKIGDAEIRESASYLALYFTLIFIGWFIFAIYGYDPLNSLFEIISLQGNVGLSTGIVSNTLPPSLTVILIFVMWGGRLEILPMLVLLRAMLEVLNKSKRKVKKVKKNYINSD
jgi:trk system potassium uptake protein TrkH